MDNTRSEAYELFLGMSPVCLITNNSLDGVLPSFSPQTTVQRTPPAHSLVFVNCWLPPGASLNCVHPLSYWERASYTCHSKQVSVALWLSFVPTNASLLCFCLTSRSDTYCYHTDLVLLEFKHPNFLLWLLFLYIEFLTTDNIPQDRCLLTLHMENYVISPVLCTIICSLPHFFLNWV